MKICDRHGPTDPRPAIDTLTVGKDDQRYDLCGECREAVFMLLSRPIQQPPPQTVEQDEKAFQKQKESQPRTRPSR